MPGRGPVHGDRPRPRGDVHRGLARLPGARLARSSSWSTAPRAARSARGWPATSGSWPSWSGGPSTTAAARSTPGVGTAATGLASTARRARRRPTRCCRRPGSSPATRASTRARSTTSSPSGTPRPTAPGPRTAPGQWPPSAPTASRPACPTASRAGSSCAPPSSASTYPVAQFATFPLPDDIGDFGSGAVTLMGPDDVFATLFEYGPESVGTALFARQGRPDRLLGRPTSPPCPAARASPGSPAPSGSSPRPGRPSPSTPCSAATPCRASLVPRVNELLTSLTLSPRRHRRPRREAAVELIGLYLIAAGLLVVAGVAKAVRPDDTARAMAALAARRPGAALRLAAPARPGRRAGRGRARAPSPSSVPRPLTAALVALSYARLRRRRRLRPLARRPARHLRLLRAARHAAHRPCTWCSTSCWPPPRPSSPPAPRATGTLATQLAHQPVGRVPAPLRQRGRALADPLALSAAGRARRRRAAWSGPRRREGRS